MFHATAMVADYDAALAPLRDLFGARVLHDNVEEDEGIGRRGGMTWIGDGSIELGEPAGPRSPVRGFVERFGGGMHSVALQVDDIDAAKQHLEAAGARIVSEPYRGMLWTHPGDADGVLLQWYSLEQDDDPRWGAPVPDGPAPVVPVQRLAFVAAEVDDPAASARRIAELACTPWWEVHGSGRATHAVSTRDSAIALMPRTGDRSRVRGVGLKVDSLDAAERALAASGVRGTRAHGWLTLDAPAVPFPVHLIDDDGAYLMHE
jgi:methylmalonyl-CoA/ethylmalonyl-CoA epimerase